MSDENTIPLEVLIQIRDEIAGLNRTRAGLQGAKKDADSLGSAIRQGLGIGGGLALVTTGIALLRQTLNASAGAAFRLATETRNVAQANQQSTESYQVLKDLVEDTGGEVGSLTMSLKEMREALKASGQGGGAADSFHRLNIDIETFSRLPVEHKLESIAKATFNAEDRTAALGAASEILGSRNLPKLTNALQVLARDGYAKVAKEAKDAGQVMTEDTVRRLHAAQLQIQNLKDSVTIGVGETMGLGGKIVDSAKKNFWQTLIGVGSWAMGNPGVLAGTLAVNAPDKPLPKPDDQAPALATREAILQAKIAASEWKGEAMAGNPLLTETQQRQSLVRILGEQEELYTALIKLKYADVDVTQPQDGATEEQLQRWKERNELEQRLAEIRRSRMEQVDTPIMALLRQMNDTTSLINTSLAQGTGQAISQLGNDVWEAFKGTQAWGEAWRNMGDIAGRTLTNILTQMLVIQAINGVLGLFGYSINGAGPSVGKIGPMTTKVKAAGGANFLTSGPTQLTVGDNPGGIEHVSVTPISGIGQTVVNGQRVAMAGGGNLLAAGRAAGSIVVNQVLNVSTGVVDTVRQEIVAMMPAFRELAVDSVREAVARGES